VNDTEDPKAQEFTEHDGKLFDFYLEEYKCLKSELAAAKQASDTNFRFAITITAGTWALNKGTSSAIFLIVFLLTFGLWAKTRKVHERQPLAYSYLDHLSKKLTSSSCTLRKSPLYWEKIVFAGGSDDLRIKSPVRTNGFFDTVASWTPLIWLSLMGLQLLSAIYVAFGADFKPWFFQYLRAHLPI
jgi:hypothetical protein